MLDGDRLQIVLVPPPQLVFFCSPPRHVVHLVEFRLVAPAEELFEPIAVVLDRRVGAFLLAGIEVQFDCCLGIDRLQFHGWPLVWWIAETGGGVQAHVAMS